MSLTSRWALIGLTLVLAGPILARTIPPDTDRPAVHVPRTVEKRADLDRLEAQRLFGVALLHEKHNRLIEALRTFEDASRLDPKSAVISRSLFSLYLALDRTEEALVAGRRVMRLDPDDYHTAYVVARQLRGLDRNKEALDALDHARKSKRLHERPDLEAQVSIDLAMLYEKAGRYAEAEKALVHVVDLLDRPEAIMEAGRFSREEVNQQCAEVLERLGRVCLQAKAISRAVAAFEKAKKKDSLRAPRLSFHLAQVYQEQGKLADALAQLNSYLSNQPAGLEGYELRIKIQRQLDRGDEIIPSLTTSSDRDPNNVALKLLLARELGNAGQKADARKIYQSLLAFHVTPDVYRGLFKLEQTSGRDGAERVLTMLDQAITASVGSEKNPPSASDARRARAMMAVLREEPAIVNSILGRAIRPGRLAGLDFMTRGVLATLASRTKQLASAEALFLSCLNQPGGPRQQEAEVYSGLIRVLRLQYKHATLIEVCKQGLVKAQNTNRVLFQTELVRAYQFLGQHKEALSAADAAVAIAGSREQILMCKRVRIDALVQAGQLVKALEDCQAMLKEYNSGSDLRDVRATLSSVYQAMGKFEESERQLRLVLEADPNDATANNDLGYVMADRNKKLDEAERLIRKAIELDKMQRNTGTALSTEADKDNAAYVDSLGWVLFRQGKLGEATQELEKAASLPNGDDDPVVWDHLGDVYMKAHQVKKAQSAYRKALELYDAGARRKGDPRYKEIQQKMRLVTRLHVTP